MRCAPSWPQSDERAYVEARDFAQTLRLAESDAARRVAIDYIFPCEPAWAADDAKVIAATPPVARQQHAIVPLFGSLADERVALSLVDWLAAIHSSALMIDYACDICTALDPEAATRVLAAIAKRSVSALRVNVPPQYMETLATAMTSIVSEDMADLLGPYVQHARFGRHVVGYFEKYAALATRALAPIAKKKSMAADAARALLAGHANAARDVVTTQKTTMEDAPSLLRDPPWLAVDTTAPLSLSQLPFVETIAWEPGERERFADMPAVANTTAEVRLPTNEELTEFDALPNAQKYVDVWPRWINKKWLVLDLPDDRRLALWNARRTLYFRPPDFILARFGLDALDGLYPRDPLESDDDRMFTACLRVCSPRTALVCARVIARRRPWAERAKQWILAHAEAAAIALIPIAFGRAGRRKSTARRALRFLAAHRGDDVQRAAARYGEDATRVVDLFAFADPLARLDVRPAVVSWLRLDALPLVRTTDGRPLPRLATERIVDVLRSRGTDIPYPGIAVLRETLDARSLADLAWFLFYFWVRHGRKRTQEWMALALAAFPADDTLARLAPYVRDWAHADPRACTTLVDVLSAMGGDDANILLAAIADESRNHVLDVAVREARGKVVEAPIDLGLDARGEGVLDLGGRTVRVVLDESFVPRVVLENGRRVAQVPRASKSDDPARVAEAFARFNGLRAKAASIAKSELKKLERAMVAGDRFTLAHAESRWAKHPLLVHAARRLVWAAHRENDFETFRVVEDGTYANIDDLPMAIDAASQISIVHPIYMNDEILTRWGTLFADYEILQPFDQLGRFVFVGNTNEALAILKSVAGRTIRARTLLHTLTLHRWERPAGRRVATAWRDLRANKPGVRAFVTFTPGISLDAIRRAQDQKLNAITVPQSAALEGIERIELSELVRTAVTLAS